MASSFSSIFAILFSTVLFQMASGLIGTLSPLRGQLEGFSEIAVGAMGACYFAGFIAGCFAGPKLIGRVRHIRAFAVGAAGAAVCALLQPVWPAPLGWFVCRAVTGFCIAILSMAVESWLNDRATNENRGRILSLYIVATWGALLSGQWLLLLADLKSYQLFSIGGALYCLCLMPMGLTRLPTPAPSPAFKLNLRRVIRVSPVGVAGCLTVGLANGAFWTLAPVYVSALGFSTAQLALFMTVFIAGGTLAQWPLGRLSDGFDRRWVIAAICTGACLCGLALGLGGGRLLHLPYAFFAVVFGLGATMLPLYSLSIAHANDRLPREDFVEASAALLMITSATSIPAPLIAATLMSVSGVSALFLFTGLAHAALAIFTIVRIRVHEPPAEATRGPFNATVAGSQAALSLDPRA